jgi:putative tryptophan/tyrosine transport system substrate-binding protein
MKRRGFLLSLGGAVIWPFAVLGQQMKVPTIAVLVLGNPDPGPFMKALREELAKVGYIEGQSLRLELRSAGGDAATLGVLAGELVGLKPDVIVAWQTPSAMAAKQSTNNIPIIMAAVGDAVATGLVTNLARPEGNITGNTAIAAEVMAKNVELIRETLPASRRVAVLANTVDPFSKPSLREIELAARALGIEIRRIMMHPTENADAYFEEMSRSKVDAVIIQPTLVRKDVIELALRYQIPSFSMLSSLPTSGGLMSYGSFAPDQWREVAKYVDKVLKGGRPADLPVAQPTRFELVVNLKTAKTLGITIPPSLLARADKVIE